ncbi:MAG: hypothetical protein ACI8XB_002438 [Patiriisocius sp.]|jgi:hypothetical protein
MIKYSFLIVLAIIGISFAACDKDENDDPEVEMEVAIFDYHTHINSPDAEDKHVGETIDISKILRVKPDRRCIT